MIYDWTDQKHYPIHNRMSKLYLGHGMILDKVREKNSFRQSKWLEKYINVNRQKRNLAKNILRKISTNFLISPSMQKRSKMLAIKRKLDFIKKDDNERIFEQQPKLFFNGIHKSYRFYDSYTFKQKEVLMVKTIYLGFAELDLSLLHMCESKYDNL